VTVLVTTMAERPHLRPLLGAPQWDGAWPEFMNYDPWAGLYYDDTTRWAKHVLIATDGDDVVAKGYSIPFAFPTERRTELPADGWDAVIRWGRQDFDLGVTPTCASALEITIMPSHRGTGLSRVMVETMCRTVGELGYPDLYAPVRPTAKSTQPELPMREYIEQRRPDGLPTDPWLRVHERVGGQILGVCPTAMTITGTLEQWREWTGLPFDRSGDVLVPHALVPVHVDVENDHAVYVEPNVWVRHRL
jgi:GNAT superfamily N-acetyltransferase